MARSSTSSFHLQSLKKKTWLLLILALFSISTLIILLMRANGSTSCDDRLFSGTKESKMFPKSSSPPISPLSFMKSKLVLMVSHELSLSGGPLLLMELAFLLRGVGAEVVWITYQKPADADEVVYSLENKMLDRGVQIHDAKGQEAIDTALKADLVVLNTAVAGKWLDAVLKDEVPHVLPKVLWWIHEMRGHYFKLEFVKHLPFVSAAMIDSHTTAEYWKNRTKERLGYCMMFTICCILNFQPSYLKPVCNAGSRTLCSFHDYVKESAELALCGLS